MSNDLDWENTQPQDQQVDDVVDEALGEGQSYDDQQGSEVLAEAIERIEQAKLYESLIKHDFFAQGSARQEIQDRVTREIRGFILERLEILLGIKAPASRQPQQAVVSSPFDSEEVDALKMLAGRMIEKGRAVSQPTTFAEPQVKQFAGTQSEPQPRQVKPSNPRPNQVKTQPPRQAPRPKAPPAKALIEKTPEERLADGTYKPQAVSKTHPPKPMPNQLTMNAMNAAEVAKRQSLGAVGLNDQILRLAVSASQSINRDIVETLNE